MDDTCLQKEGNRVGQDDWYGVNPHTVNQPQQDACAERDQHAPGQVVCGFRPPRFRELRHKRRRCQRPSR